MKAQGIAIGYHACSLAVARKVLLLSEQLIAGYNPWDWLGNGIYFWENNLERALDWSPSYRSFDREEMCVIGAVIDLGNCLDLYDRACTNEVRDAYLALKELFQRAGRKLPRNIPSGPEDLQHSVRKLDCLVLNYVHDTNQALGNPPYDTVRGGFDEGQELYPGAKLYDQTHIQICVRDPRSILGYFKPVGVNL